LLECWAIQATSLSTLYQQARAAPDCGSLKSSLTEFSRVWAYNPYTVLSVIGVTPDGDLVVLKNQVSIVWEELSARWMIYLCPPAHYKELEQAYRTEQAKMREDLKREFG
jgi:hypothetical protein